MGDRTAVEPSAHLRAPSSLRLGTTVQPCPSPWQSIFFPLFCRDYQQLLPIGGFSPAYFEGATAILAQACSQSFPPCAPGGEVANPVLPPGVSGR